MMDDSFLHINTANMSVIFRGETWIDRNSSGRIFIVSDHLSDFSFKII